MKTLLPSCLLVLFAFALLTPAYADSDKRDSKGKSHHSSEHRKKDHRIEHFRTSKRHNYYTPGRRFEQLPSRHHQFSHRGKDYYYFGGNFFHHTPTHYVTVRAPIGARVPYLAPGYVRFNLNSNRYYYSGYTYYRWDDRHRDYIVVAEPRGASDAIVTAAASSTGEIYAYPAKGQSAEQQDRDYYDCHVWGVQKSDYDPSLEAQDADSAQDYRRAMTACLEGRGYSVK